MKIRKMAAIFILGILPICALACAGVPQATPTPTPTRTPTPTPTQCEADRDAVQEAIHSYHAEKGEWPTESGGPGDIEWEKLVPSFLQSTPTTDDNCDWSVNSDPEGEVCVGGEVGCIPCSCRCGTGCAE